MPLNNISTATASLKTNNHIGLTALLKLFNINLQNVGNYEFGNNTGKLYKINFGLSFIDLPQFNFNYLVLEIPCQKNYGTMFIYDRAQSGQFVEMNSYIRVKHIELESNEFNEKYEIFSPNERLAWEFFSPDLMAVILDSSLPHFSMSIFPNFINCYLPCTDPSDAKLEGFVGIAKQIYHIVG